MAESCSVVKTGRGGIRDRPGSWYPYEAAVVSLFQWRQELCPSDEAAAATFAAVTVSPGLVLAPALSAPSGVIEIEFANGYR
jgi:hypothetical protein